MLFGFYPKKLIYITPEETVRQSVILYLTDTLYVPMQEIISEQHLSHYGITSKKREDIVIYALDADQQSVPIAVIECKAPNVYLDMKAKEPWAEQGNGKIDELRMFVEDRYPRIISGKRFFLGSIVNDRLWRLNDPDVIGLIENMISYLIVRDEYREYVKAKRNT